MHGHRGSAKRATDHDLQARHRRDERLLKKAELAIPQETRAGKDRREQHRHSDYARCDKLKIAAVAGTLEDRAEAEAENQQIQHRAVPATR